MAEPTNDQPDDNQQLYVELDRELAVAMRRLTEANADVHAVTRTAMDLALRLDESEKRVVELQDEMTELRMTQLADLEHLTREQAETISRQQAYIQRLRRQIERPGRLMAKKALAVPKRLTGRG